MLTWLLYLPASKTSVAPPPLSNFGAVCSNVSKWLPPILPNCLALMIQMYAVSFFTAIPFYIYNNGIPPSFLAAAFCFCFCFCFSFHLLSLLLSLLLPFPFLMCSLSDTLLTQFLSFPYVCPEPVLVKSSFVYINGEKRPFCHLLFVVPGMCVLVAEFPDGGKISMIFGTASNALMNHDRYFAVFNMHTFLGRFLRNVFFAPFYTSPKAIFLPRQARHRHRER
jgi:hypothetical protein